MSDLRTSNDVCRDMVALIVELHEVRPVGNCIIVGSPNGSSGITVKVMLHDRDNFMAREQITFQASEGQIVEMERTSMYCMIFLGDT